MHFVQCLPLVRRAFHGHYQGTSRLDSTESGTTELRVDKMPDQGLAEGTASVLRCLFALSARYTFKQSSRWKRTRGAPSLSNSITGTGETGYTQDEAADRSVTRWTRIRLMIRAIKVVAVYTRRPRAYVPASNGCGLYIGLHLVPVSAAWRRTPGSNAAFAPYVATRLVEMLHASATSCLKHCMAGR